MGVFHRRMIAENKLIEEALADTPPALTLKEIAEKTGLSRPLAWRRLQGLVRLSRVVKLKGETVRYMGDMR